MNIDFIFKIAAIGIIVAVNLLKNRFVLYICYYLVIVTLFCKKNDFRLFV